MPAELQLQGKRFGWITAIKRANVPPNKRGVYWICKCDCGKEKIILGRHLVKGETKSCGCQRYACLFTHGLTRTIGKVTRIWRIWSGMRRRCGEHKHHAYKWYGAKGVKVCKAWHDYKVFHDWAIANGYADNLTIDRINSKGDYNPSNCRWITLIENSKKAIQGRTQKGIKGFQCHD